jgi:hypothetical protein
VTTNFAGQTEWIRKRAGYLIGIAASIAVCLIVPEFGRPITPAGRIQSFVVGLLFTVRD